MLNILVKLSFIKFIINKKSIASRIDYAISLTECDNSVILFNNNILVENTVKAVAHYFNVDKVKKRVDSISEKLINYLKID